MAISAESAARWLCKKAEWQITNLKIQKLLYLAHMVYVGQNNGETLIRENFEAWDYGPVIPKIYHKAKLFGTLPVKDVFLNAKDISNTKEAGIIEKAEKQFSHLTPSQLVAITHLENGAWSKNYEPGVKGIVIPTEDILEEYRAWVNASG
jgi:uncharacterized phage-associated protein